VGFAGKRFDARHRGLPGIAVCGEPSLARCKRQHSGRPSGTCQAHRVHS
jgi:hypothetical protein